MSSVQSADQSKLLSISSRLRGVTVLSSGICFVVSVSKTSRVAVVDVPKAFPL